MSPVSSDRRATPIAIVLFVLAFGFRLIGITWGLPNDLHNQSLHPDETVVYTNYAYRINPAALQFTPGNYNYPTLYPLLLRIAGDMATTYTGAEDPRLGPPPSRMSEIEPYLVKQGKHERVVNTAGRVLNCLAGAGTAVLVFFLLLRVTSLAGALFGGGLAAIAPALVVHARFQTVDVTSTFFLMAAILCAIKLLPTEDEVASPDLKYALLAGLFAGLSAGTKYTGILAILSLWTALGFRRHPRAIQLGLAGLAVAVVVFLLTTPGALLDTQQFLKGVRSESSHMRTGHGFAFVNTPVGFIYQICNLLTGIGPLAAILGLAGLVVGAAKRKPWVWVVLAATLPYFILIGTSEVKFVRYALPLMPVVACGFGNAVAAAIQRPRWRAAGWILGAVALLGLESVLFSAVQKQTLAQCLDLRFGGLYGASRYTTYMLQEDPRDEAARYLKSGNATRVGLFRRPWFWTVPVVHDANYLYTRDNLTGPLFSMEKNPAVQFSEMPPPADHIAWSAFEVDPLRRAASRPDSVPQAQREDFASLMPELDRIDRTYTLERSFGGDIPDVEDLMYIHPRVDVLRLK